MLARSRPFASSASAARRSTTAVPGSMRTRSRSATIRCPPCSSSSGRSRERLQRSAPRGSSGRSQKSEQRCSRVCSRPSMRRYPSSARVFFEGGRSSRSPPRSTLTLPSTRSVSGCRAVVCEPPVRLPISASGRARCSTGGDIGSLLRVELLDLRRRELDQLHGMRAGAVVRRQRLEGLRLALGLHREVAGVVAGGAAPVDLLEQRGVVLLDLVERREALLRRVRRDHQVFRLRLVRGESSGPEQRNDCERLPDRLDLHGLSSRRASARAARHRAGRTWAEACEQAWKKLQTHTAKARSLAKVREELLLQNQKTSRPFAFFATSRCAFA